MTPPYESRSRMTTDPVLKTLFLPLETAQVDLDEEARVLFLRARAGRELALLDVADLTCEQSFAPSRDALDKAGYKVSAETDEDGFDLVLVLPTRQRQEARAQLARAAMKVRPGGMVLACAANTEGAKTLESDLESLLGGADSLSKNKCRVVWHSMDPEKLDTGLMAEWSRLDEPRAVLDGSWQSRPGLFAWDRIDPASRLLIDHLPETLSGRGADLGAGFGVLSRALLDKAPKVTSIDLYEAEKRALDLAQENLKSYRERATLTGIWSDVTKGIEGPYDFVIMNPPFHQTGKADRADVGQGFIKAAFDGLRSSGLLYLVANRHLPYEHTLKDLFASVDMIADEGGYKVICARKGKGR